MSTPQLFLAVARSVPTVSALRLVGRDAARLEAVARACRSICPVDAPTLECMCSYPSEEVLGGSDVVLVQFRIGGFDARARDEALPLAFGVVGDEGLGPSGLAAARRTWAVLHTWLDRIAEQAPRAEVVLLTSPAGLLVRLASLTHPQLRVTHVCELPWRTLSDWVRAHGEDPLAADFAYHGVNHLGWFHSVRVGHRDLLSEGTIDPSSRLSKWVRTHQALPLPYNELLLDPEAVVGRQAALPGKRALELQRLSRRATRVFARGSTSTIVQLLDARPAPWYALGVAPLLRAIGGDVPHIPMFLTRRWSDGSTTERAFRRDVPGFSEQATVQSPPEWLRSLTADLLEAERLGASAVLLDSVDLAADALACHPFVPEGLCTRSLAARIWRDHPGDG
jgi:6-phospho-beta-glucosidase